MTKPARLLTYLLTCVFGLAACDTPPAETGAPNPRAAGQSAPASSGTADASSAPVSPSVAADMDAIRAAGARKATAYNSANADAIATLYADDAILLPPTAPAVKGRAAIRKFLFDYWAQLAAGGYSPFFDSTVDIRISGDFGLRSGTFYIKDKAGALADSGKWLEVWSRSGDTWRISRDIWNSDSLPLMLATEPDDGGDAPQ